MWAFTVHVTLGSFAFLIVFDVAVIVGWQIDVLERIGAHKWVIEYARWGEAIILWMDLFGLALFLAKEFIRLARHIVLKDWDDFDGQAERT